MYKLARYLAVLPVLMVLIHPVLAEAHILKNDNGYSAVLHIDPDDNPVAAVPTKLNFLMSNQNGSFALADHDLQVKVSDSDGKTVATKPVMASEFGDAADASATVTFAKADVYQLVLTGSSHATHSPEFKMSYLVRVAPSTAPAPLGQGSGLTLLLLGISGVVVVGIVGYGTVRSRRSLSAAKLN